MASPRPPAVLSSSALAPAFRDGLLGLKGPQNEPYTGPFKGLQGIIASPYVNPIKGLSKRFLGYNSGHPGCVGREVPEGSFGCLEVGFGV